MRTFQLHYTSCLAGQTSGSGLQTRTFTAGMSHELRREIESRISYRPPRDAPDAPTADQILDFPIAWRYFALGTDRWIALRIAYAGQDYTSRWGNIFGHGLAGEGGLPSFHPVELMDWEGWRGPLEPGEDTEATPALLDVPTFVFPEADPTFSTEALATFLKETPGRAELLGRMVTAVLAGRPQHRPLVVRDAAAEGAYWVAAVLRCLPLEAARQLSYSTYQFHDRGCADVNATTGETDIPFDERTRRDRFYCFEPMRRIESEVSPTFAAYGETLAGWLAAGSPQFGRFETFAAGFDRIEPDGDTLGRLLRLFLLAELGGNTTEWVELANFGVDRVRPGSVDLLARHLGRAVTGAIGRASRRRAESGGSAELSLNADLHAALELIAPLAALAPRCSPELRLLAVERWLDAWPLACASEDLADAVALRTMLATEGAVRPTSEIARGARRRLVEEQVLGAVLDQLLQSRASARAVRRALGIVTEALRAEGQLVAGHHWIEVCLAHLVDLDSSPDGVFSALEPFAASPSELAAMAAALARPGAEPSPDRSGTVGAAVARLATQREAAFGDALRAALDAGGAHEILHHEALASLQVARDIESAWDTWTRRIPKVAPAFAVAGIDRVAAEAIMRLPRPRAARVALDLLKRGVAARLPKETLAHCLERANDAIPVGEVVRDDDVILLVSEAGAAKVRLTPNRPILHGFVQLVHQRERISADLERDCRAALTGLPDAEYDRLLKLTLKSLLDQASHPNDLRTILGALATPDRLRPFALAYDADLDRRLKLPWSKSLEASLYYWLEEGDNPLAARRTLVLDRFVERFATSSDLDPELARVASQGGRAGAALRARVEDRRKGAWGRFTSSVSGLFGGKK